MLIQNYIFKNPDFLSDVEIRLTNDPTSFGAMPPEGEPLSETEVRSILSYERKQK